MKEKKERMKGRKEERKKKERKKKENAKRKRQKEADRYDRYMASPNTIIDELPLCIFML